MCWPPRGCSALRPFCLSAAILACDSGFPWVVRPQPPIGFSNVAVRAVATMVPPPCLDCSQLPPKCSGGAGSYVTMSPLSISLWPQLLCVAVRIEGGFLLSDFPQGLSLGLSHSQSPKVSLAELLLAGNATTIELVPAVFKQVLDGFGSGVGHKIFAVALQLSEG